VAIIGPLPVSGPDGYATGELLYLDTVQRIAADNPGFTNPRPFTDKEARDVDQAAADNAANAAIVATRAQAAVCRDSLNDAVQLAALSPYPTPEEQAIIDAQVSASLALFRALADPPADVTALAAAVLTLEVQR
jgi:hypothetical protein